MNKKFFKQYFNNQINLLNFDDEVISKLEKHEAECNLRYQRIEEKLTENKSALKAFDVKPWCLAVLILIAPFVGKLMGQNYVLFA